MVPYKTYNYPSESLSDRRRRRRLLRRKRWRGRWLALLLVSSAMTLSWVGLSRSGLEVRQVRHSAQALIQSPQLLPGTATAAPPRLAKPLELHYEDWVVLLRQEADTVATKNLPDLNLLAGDSISLWFPSNLLPQDQPWLNQGISGETTEGLQRRLEDWQGLQPRRIFLMIGINDLIRGDSVAAVVEANQRIVEQLRLMHPETEIIVQSLLPHGGDRATWEGKDKLQAVSLETIQRVNRKLRAIAQAESAQYLDLYPLFSDSNGFLRSDLTTDGLHLNPQGYLVWSTALKMFEQQDQPQDLVGGEEAEFEARTEALN